MGSTHRNTRSDHAVRNQRSATRASVDVCLLRSQWLTPEVTSPGTPIGHDFFRSQLLKEPQLLFTTSGSELSQDPRWICLDTDQLLRWEAPQMPWHMLPVPRTKLYQDLPSPVFGTMQGLLFPRPPSTSVGRPGPGCQGGTSSHTKQLWRYDWSRASEAAARHLIPTASGNGKPNRIESSGRLGDSQIRYSQGSFYQRPSRSVLHPTNREAPLYTNKSSVMIMYVMV